MKKILSLLLFSSLLILQVNSFAQSSDFCEDAIPIACGETILGTTNGMTVDAVACPSNASAPGVWFVYTGEGNVTLSTCEGTDYDSKISVFESTNGDCSSITCLVNNDDACGLQSSVDFVAIDVATYYIMVHGFGSNTGIFNLTATCNDTLIAGCTDPFASNFDSDAVIDDGSCTYEGQDNDFCASATPVIEDQLMFVNNINATPDFDFWGECWGFGNGEAEQNSVWYSFTTPDEAAAINLVSIADNSGTLTDTQFALFDACDGEVIACDGNSGQGMMAAFYFACGELETSTTYYLMIDGWNSDSGTCFLSYEANVCGPVSGCTDAAALNYNPLATIDDGSCEYPEPCDDNTVIMSMAMDNFPSEGSWSVFDNEYQVVASSTMMESGENITVLCLVDGCYTLEMYDSFGDGWDFGGSSDGLVTVTTPSGAFTTFFDQGDFAALAFGVNEDGCEFSILGCTDPLALNYNQAATEDDGTCEYETVCDDVLATLYVCTFANGNEVGLEILDEDSNVVYSNFNYNNGELMYTDICLEEGVCYTVNMYNTVNTGWYGGYYWININGVQVTTGFPADDQNFATMQFSTNGPCGDFYPGCMDVEACNYDSTANYDDNSCTYPGCMNPEAYNYTPNAGCNDEELCIFLDPVENDACTDAIAIACGDNVSGLTIGATVDNMGICGTSNTSAGVWYVLEGDDSFVTLSTCGQADYDTKISVFSSDDGCDALVCVTGNDDACSLQSSVEFNAVDGTTYYVLVHGFSSATGTFTLSVECGDEVIVGCTDPNACNYDSLATINDGSCTYPGCMDSNAINYNPMAGCDDESCTYLEDCEFNAVVATLVVDQFPGEMSWEILNDQDQIVLAGSGIEANNDGFVVTYGCLEDGCYTINMYDSFGDGWDFGNDGGLFITIGETQVVAATVADDFYSVDFSINADCDGQEDVLGCTDPIALNFNSTATIDDGSCIYFEEYPCIAEFLVVEIDTENNNVVIVNLSEGEDLEFFWDFGDGNTSTEPFPMHQYAEDGTYTVCLTVSSTVDSCMVTYCADIAYEAPGLIIGGNEGVNGTTAEGFTINVISPETVAVEEINATLDYSLYPNPAQTTLTLTGTNNENTVVTIYNLTGKEVYSERIINDRNEINVSNFSNGIYIMKIQNSTDIITKRFEVVR